jgi:hypothetical protein
VDSLGGIDALIRSIVEFAMSQSELSVMQFTIVTLLYSSVSCVVHPRRKR